MQLNFLTLFVGRLQVGGNVQYIISIPKASSNSSFLMDIYENIVKSQIIID